MRRFYDVPADMGIKGFYTAFTRKESNGYFFAGESHDFWEAVYCLKGEAYVSADEKIICLTENRIIFHKPMEFHSLRIEKGVDTELYIMSFEAGKELMKKFENGIFFLNSEQKRSIIDMFAILKSSVKKSKENYLEDFAEKKHGICVLKNLAENFLFSLYETDASPAKLVKNSGTMVYSAALRIIDERSGEKLTVDALARECNVSSAYLKKIFEKYNGLGIHEYILKNKITAAKQLLAVGEQVAVVSEKLGFSSRNYFSIAFKREVGISPAEYRKTSVKSDIKLM